MQKIAAYTIERELGAGAQGEVFKAVHDNGQVVALKLLREEFAGDPEIAGRFQRESRVAQSVRHPNVVSALDAGVENGRPWLAYAFVSGGDLDALIKRSVRLPQVQALRLLKEIVSGLAALHEHGLVHRDIKPANILITEEGHAAITDHGLARSTSDARTQYTQTGAIVGSPAYMAPEQIEGFSEIDIRADLYASGIVFYEMLSGSIPFTGGHIVEILNKHLEVAPPNICQTVPGTHAQCADLLNLLLEKKVKKRIADPVAIIQKIDLIINALVQADAQATLMNPDQTLDMNLSNDFPSTMDADSQTFPMTLDQDESFPSTIDESAADFPMTIDEQAAFPGTMDASAAGQEQENVVDVTLRMDESVADVALEASPDSGSSGSARLRLSMEHAGEQCEMFVYAGDQMRMGRTGLDRSDAEVCLRIRPAAGNEDLIRKISGLHVTLGFEHNRTFVQDNKSSVGTTINGTALRPNVSEFFTEPASLRVANVLDLEVNPIQSGNVRYIINGSSSNPETGGIYVTRPQNGSEHCYLLVNGSCAFNEQWEPSTQGGLVLMNIDGGLWLHHQGIANDHAIALVPGVRFTIGDYQVSAFPIQPSDQK